MNPSIGWLIILIPIYRIAGKRLLVGVFVRTSDWGESFGLSEIIYWVHIRFK